MAIGKAREQKRLESIFDSIVGTGAGETLTGTDGRDTIEGIGGPDVLRGLGGKDRLEGGAGRDTLVGGGGRDTLIGGPQGDVYTFEKIGDSRPDRPDLIPLYGGMDRMDFSAIDADKLTPGDQQFAYVGALSGQAGELAWRSDGAGGTIVEGDVDGDALADFYIEIRDDRRDSLQGTDGDDTLIGYDGGEIIGAEYGSDADLVLGGGGNDTLYGIYNDTLDGGAGNDRIQAGHNTVFGGNGNDLIANYTNTVSANVDGGAGDDTIEVAGSSTVDGGTGDDDITVEAYGSNLTGIVRGGEGNDTVAVVEPYGWTSNDHQLSGEDGADVLTGSSSDDTLDGGAGDDLLFASRDNEHPNGGNDHLNGGAGDDLLFADRGDDHLTGGSGRDVLHGDSDDDGVAGNDDVLTGGAGADTLDGGARDLDVYVYESLADSTVAEPDLIVKLTRNDAIDLSAIDADVSTNGDQAFALVTGFTGAAGELRLRLDGLSGDTFIEGDVNGDAIADFLIVTNGDQLDFTAFVF